VRRTLRCKHTETHEDTQVDFRQKNPDRSIKVYDGVKKRKRTNMYYCRTGYPHKKTDRRWSNASSSGIRRPLNFITFTCVPTLLRIVTTTRRVIPSSTNSRIFICLSNRCLYISVLYDRRQPLIVLEISKTRSIIWSTLADKGYRTFYSKVYNNLKRRYIVYEFI